MNNELKKQFENNVKKYEEIVKEVRNAIKETEKANEELKKLWQKWRKEGIKKQVETIKEYQEKKENLKINKIVKSEKNEKYFTILLDVQKKILEIAAKNIFISALKEESEKEKSKILNKPCRYKVVQDFLINILESENIHCYVSVKDYYIEVCFYIKNGEYHSSSEWININLGNLTNGIEKHYGEELYFDDKKIKECKFDALNYNPEEITNNYINFVNEQKNKLETFKKEWNEKRNQVTLNGKFSYLGNNKDSITEYFYF